MNKVISFLEGKKSYIVTLLIAVYTLLKSFNVIVTTPEQDVTVYGLLFALFGVAVRKAIK